LSLQAIQSLLFGDEVVIFVSAMFVSHFDESVFIWAISKNEAAWMRSTTTVTAIDEAVGRIRCSVNQVEMTTDKGKAKCAALGILAAEKPSVPPAFPAESALLLYKALIEPFETIVRDRKIVFISN